MGNPPLRGRASLPFPSTSHQIYVLYVPTWVAFITRVKNKLVDIQRIINRNLDLGLNIFLVPLGLPKKEKLIDFFPNHNIFHPEFGKTSSSSPTPRPHSTAAALIVADRIWQDFYRQHKNVEHPRSGSYNRSRSLYRSQMTSIESIQYIGNIGKCELSRHFFAN